MLKSNKFYLLKFCLTWPIEQVRTAYYKLDL